MNEIFIRDRITQLRMQKNISEYKMSLDLGHSKSYIQSISSGKSLPSLSEFLSICSYLEVTPKEFFDTSDNNPGISHELNVLFKKLDYDEQLLILNLVQKLSEK